MNPELLVGSGKHPGSSTGVKEPHNHECDPVRYKLRPTQLWPDFISVTTEGSGLLSGSYSWTFHYAAEKKKKTCPRECEENSPVGLNTKGNRDVQPGMHIFISISSNLIHPLQCHLLAPCPPYSSISCPAALSLLSGWTDISFTKKGRAIYNWDTQKPYKFVIRNVAFKAVKSTDHETNNVLRQGDGTLGA